MQTFLLHYHFRSLHPGFMSFALKDEVRMFQPHQWLSPLRSNRTETHLWRKVSLPDDTPSHGVQAKQAEQGWGQEWFCHQENWQVRPQVKAANFGQRGWSQALLQHRSGQEYGAPAKGKTYECSQRWALCYYICSAVPCTVTVLVQETELGTAPGILTSCKHCFGISK